MYPYLTRGRSNPYFGKAFDRIFGRNFRIASTNEPTITAPYTLKKMIHGENSYPDILTNSSITLGSNKEKNMIGILTAENKNGHI